LITNHLTPEWAARFFHLGHDLTPTAVEYWRQSAELFGNVGICSLWFAGTKLFWSRAPAETHARVEEFFRRLNTPVDFAGEEGVHAANDGRQARVVGWLCVAYGTFVALLAFIPNPLPGRIAFLGCGALVFGIGGALLISSQAKRSRPA
jgi:SSS family solute:Na+ symporter